MMILLSATTPLTLRHEDFLLHGLALKGRAKKARNCAKTYSAFAAFPRCAMPGGFTRAMSHHFTR
jgi:hypothetical protein